METLILFGKWCAHVSDPVFSWLLNLPYDVAILIVGIGTSVLMTLGRKVVTNQELLKRCKLDQARLAQLRKQAKANKDKKTLTNIAATLGMIQMKNLGAEMKGLAVSIIPILFLASWAFERLDYTAPKVGEEFNVRITFPKDAISSPAWLSPDPAGKIQPVNGAVQFIRPDDNIDPFTGHKIMEEVGNGLVTWRLKVVQPSDDIKLRVGYQGKTFTPVAKVGGTQYGDPIVLPDAAKAPWPSCSAMLDMQRPLFLSRVPGVTAFWKWWVKTSLWMGPTPPVWDERTPLTTKIWDKTKYWGVSTVYWISRVTLFAPWLTAYLIITIPFVPLSRRLLRVY